MGTPILLNQLVLASSLRDKKRPAETLPEGIERLGNGAEVVKLAVAPGGHQAGTLEDLQVVRDRRLCHRETARQLSARDFAVARDLAQEAQTGLIR